LMAVTCERWRSRHIGLMDYSHRKPLLFIELKVTQQTTHLTINNVSARSEKFSKL
jgi:hypothetical protein